MATIVTTPTYTKNPTDRKQNNIEGVAFSGGIATFEDDKTRVIAKGANGTPELTAHGTAVGSLGKNAGVVMNPSDQPNRFMSDLIGRPTPTIKNP